jgi:predicted MFS family arabinose efflux permease
MTDTSTIDNRRHGHASVAVAIWIGIVGALVSNTLPAFLAVLARMRGLTESQSGLSAMADIGGIAFGVIACALTPSLVNKLNWRRTIVLGLLILIAANLLSIMVASFQPYLAVRLLSGFGSGVIIAIVYAILAEGDGARSLAIFNAGQLATASFIIPYFSALADQHGVAILFAIIAGVAAVSLLLTPFLPRESARELQAEARHSHVSEKVNTEGWIAIVSVLLMFIGVGCVFGFLSYMGAAWGIAPAEVEGHVSKIVFAGLIGAVMVAAIGSRFGFWRPLMIGFAMLLTSIGLFALVKPVSEFLAVGMLFYFAVNVTMTYQFEAVTEIDSSSSAAMLVSAGTLGGVAIGPAIAGYLVTPDYAVVNGMGWGAVAASFFLLVLAKQLHARKIS